MNLGSILYSWRSKLFVVKLCAIVCDEDSWYSKSAYDLSSKKLWTFASVMVASASASTHLEKYSTVTNKNFL